MKSLDTLLKVAQRKLDAVSIEVTKAQVRIDEMRAEEAAILAREAGEMAAAAQDFGLAPYLPAYRARVKAQLQMKRAEIADGEEHVAEIRERLSKAYQEKAKFEQLIERERERVMAERAAAEQAMLDEAAINRVGRD